jgi:hypothetical protein
MSPTCKSSNGTSSEIRDKKHASDDDRQDEQRQSPGIEPGAPHHIGAALRTDRILIGAEGARPLPAANGAFIGFVAPGHLVNADLRFG